MVDEYMIKNEQLKTMHCLDLVYVFFINNKKLNTTNCNQSFECGVHQHQTM